MHCYLLAIPESPIQSHTDCVGSGFTLVCYCVIIRLYSNLKTWVDYGNGNRNNEPVRPNGLLTCSMWEIYAGRCSREPPWHLPQLLQVASYRAAYLKYLPCIYIQMLLRNAPGNVFLLRENGEKKKKINNSCLHTSLARTAYREAKEGKKDLSLCVAF